MSKTAQELFVEVYGKSTNPMTPKVVKHGFAGQYVYEISKGDSIFTQSTVYGVTVGDIVTKTKNHDKSKCFYSWQEVKDYIGSLAEEPRQV